MNTPNSDRFKIGAWISKDTKRRADMFRALSGHSLQEIYETALCTYLDAELPKIEETRIENIIHAQNNSRLSCQQSLKG
ncbi:MAG: hypothetical protein JEY71_04720 [Sphaerochaeta sp.]|nr:hypothetical protein [Sphaerochaeta sp.]